LNAMKNFGDLEGRKMAHGVCYAYAHREELSGTYSTSDPVQGETDR
jgi:hypothetical protein